jgi:hypothetical protein
MTKKDYELIAGILKGAQNYEATFNDNEKGAKAIEAVTHTFAVILATTNPRFNEDLFLKACGVSN